MKWGLNKDWRKEIGSQSLEWGPNKDWRKEMMCASKKGGLFLEVGSDVDGDLRRLCLVSVGGGHNASRASLQAELARLALSVRPWFRPDTVTGKRKLKERSERENWKREAKERTGRENWKRLAVARTGLVL